MEAWKTKDLGRSTMATKRILILKSSPRNKSNSSLLADQVAAGARAAGAQVESYDLHNMDIQPCDACEACRDATDDDCILDDDMQLLYPRLRDADGIVLASPIYWFTMSAQLKLCIDRWYALGGPQGHALAGKQFGVVLAYGDDDPLASGAVNAVRTFQDMIRYLDADLAGMVYCTANDPGEVQSQPESMERAYRLGQKLGAAAG
jgi:multimeric flavodoxin WrbA